MQSWYKNYGICFYIYIEHIKLYKFSDLPITGYALQLIKHSIKDMLAWLKNACNLCYLYDFNDKLLQEVFLNNLFFMVFSVTGYMYIYI